MGKASKMFFFHDVSNFETLRSNHTPFECQTCRTLKKQPFIAAFGVNNFFTLSLSSIRVKGEFPLTPLSVHILQLNDSSLTRPCLCAIFAPTDGIPSSDAELHLVASESVAKALILGSDFVESLQLGQLWQPAEQSRW